MLAISSKGTYLVKRVVPVLLGVALCFCVCYSIPESAASPADYWVRALLATLLFVFIAFLAGGLADEVFDCGDELFVRKGSAKERITLTSIVQVEEGYVRPHTLRLASFTEVIVTMDGDTAFGRRFRFLAPRYGLGGGYGRVGVVNHLRLRAERAREKRAVQPDYG
jgi:hypothetical protein